MAFTEDFQAFLSQAEFADSALLGGLPVSVIFDRAYIDASGMSSGRPNAKLASASVPASPVGQTLQITSGLGLGSWRIAEVIPDGTGMSDLVLEKP
jgi:hypothetical protein